MDWYAARAALEWQVELGVREAIGEVPLNRYDLPKVQPKAVVAKAAAGPVDPVEAAKAAAGAAATLSDLRQAMAAYPHCELQRGARSLVFADGAMGAPVMIVGEAPGRDEDIQGKPFVGRAGQLLDKMLAAVGLSRAETVYITNILPYRPPQNRDPRPDEVAMMMPFVRRHIALAAPKVLICMGNHSCHAILGKKGITKLRGQWHRAFDLPVLPMLHPAYLLRNPAAKKGTWADLLELRAWLQDTKDDK